MSHTWGLRIRNRRVGISIIQETKLLLTIASRLPKTLLTCSAVPLKYSQINILNQDLILLKILSSTLLQELSIFLRWDLKKTLLTVSFLNSMLGNRSKLLLILSPKFWKTIKRDLLMKINVSEMSKTWPNCSQSTCLKSALCLSRNSHGSQDPTILTLQRVLVLLRVSFLNQVHP